MAFLAPSQVTSSSSFRAIVSLTYKQLSWNKLFSYLLFFSRKCTAKFLYCCKMWLSSTHFSTDYFLFSQRTSYLRVVKKKVIKMVLPIKNVAAKRRTRCLPFASLGNSTTKLAENYYQRKKQVRTSISEKFSSHSSPSLRNCANSIAKVGRLKDMEGVVETSAAITWKS